jgi:hypothetical protein
MLVKLAFAFGIRYYPFDYSLWLNAPSLVFGIGADQGQSTLISSFWPETRVAWLPAHPSRVFLSD